MQISEIELTGFARNYMATNTSSATTGTSNKSREEVYPNFPPELVSMPACATTTRNGVRF